MHFIAQKFFLSFIDIFFFAILKVSQIEIPGPKGRRLDRHMSLNTAQDMVNIWKKVLIYIYINLIIGLPVCLFVYLLDPNLFRLKSERHETWHVGPLGTLKCLRPNGFFKFRPRSLILDKSN